MVNVDVSVVFLNRWKRSDWFYSVNMVVYTKVPKVIAYHWALDWVDLGVLKRISMDFRYIHFKTCLEVFSDTLFSLCPSTGICYTAFQERLLSFPSWSSLGKLSCLATSPAKQSNTTPQTKKYFSTAPQTSLCLSSSGPSSQLRGLCALVWTCLRIIQVNEDFCWNGRNWHILN